MDSFLILAIGPLIAYVVGSFASPVGRWLHVLDYPDPVGGRKRHDKVTPLVGGVAIALIVVTVLSAQIWLQGSLSASSPLLWLNIVAFGTFVVGFLDDRLHLAPVPRLIFAIMLFALATAYVPAFRLNFLYFDFAGQSFLLGPFAGMFTVLCLVGLVNAINMADGKNGLVIGLATIWTSMLFVTSSAVLQPVYGALLLGLVVLFYFNWRGHLFLGDGGSYGLAGLIGVSAIYAYNTGFVHLSAEQVVLWFLVPVLDCLRLMVSRVLAGRSPFSGDREHLHHYLALAFGWSKGIVIYLGIVGVPALLAWLFPQSTMALLAIVSLIYAIIIVSSTKKLNESGVLSA